MWHIQHKYVSPCPQKPLNANFSKFGEIKTGNEKYKNMLLQLIKEEYKKKFIKNYERFKKLAAFKRCSCYDYGGK